MSEKLWNIFSLKDFYNFDTKNEEKKLTIHEIFNKSLLNDSIELSIEDDQQIRDGCDDDFDSLQELQKDQKTLDNYENVEYSKEDEFSDEEKDDDEEEEEEDSNFINEEENTEDSNSKTKESNSFSNNNSKLDLADNLSEVSSNKKRTRKKTAILSPKVVVQSASKKKASPVKKKAFELNEKFFDLSNMNIDQFPIHMIDNIQFIEMLYLANNSIKKLPDELFESLKFLNYLDVRYNQLKTLPTTIKYHLSLETILLQGNLIEALPLELGLVPRLKFLQTSDNPLQFPPANILKEGFKSIIHFLRSEWNKNNPDEMINSFEDKKSSLTVLSSSSPSLKAKSSTTKGKKSVENIKLMSTNEKSRKYKPSNRCRNTLENIILLEEKYFWLNKIQQDLIQQTKILQKIKNVEALKKWRDKKHISKTNSTGRTNLFGDDNSLKKVPSFPKENIDKAMMKIISSLQQFQWNARDDKNDDVKIRLKKLQQDINQLKNIKKEIERMQMDNETSLLYFNDKSAVSNE